MDNRTHDTGPPAEYPWQVTAPGPAWAPPQSQGQSQSPGRRRSQRRGRRRVAWAGAAAVTLALGAGIGVHTAATTAAPGPVASGRQGADTDWSGTSRGGWSGTSRGGWSGGWGGFGAGGGTYPGSGSTTTATTEATDAQQTGVVDIDVVLGGTEQAAGTGLVLTSNGEILTNRHVVQGETAIRVTVPATGRSYSARVVGISTSTDVAVVQLVNASGLATVRTATHAVRVDDAVVGVGNAGGTGGRPTAAAGTVTGVEATIMASDSDGNNPERLTGLIETDAAIQPGDSGGPLLDTSNAVVGMDTAGSARGGDGYAIPIATALSVARSIEAGGSGTQAGAGSSTSTRPSTQTSTRRAYLGVAVEDGPSGALIGDVTQGSPAAAAGLEAGDTITSLAGHRVGSVADLASVMASVTPGRRVTVTWIDAAGTAHTGRVTPAAVQA